jgi:hypothetical protein
MTECVVKGGINVMVGQELNRWRLGMIPTKVLICDDGVAVALL